MRDEEKTKEQLINELVELRRRVAELEKLESKHKEIEEALRKSEEHFHLLVNGIEDYAIFMLDPEGRVISWNKGAERITGYKEEEIIGQHVSIFFTSEDVQRGKPEQLLQKAIAEGRVEDEGWHVRKDGSQFWAFAVITALRDKTGALRGFAQIARDLTERRKAEETMRRLASVVSYSNDAVTVQSLEGQILAWNRGAEQMYNYTEAEALGMNIHKIIPESKREEAQAMTRRLSRGEAVESFETQRITKDGRVLDVWLTASPLVDHTGKPIAIATTERDITERKRVEKQIKDSLREKEVLLKEIHHRVKNNLQIISSLLNLQSRYIKDKQTLEMLRESQNRIRAMALVHEKLYQSKDLTKVNLAEYLQKEVADLFRSYGVSSEAIKLKIDTDDVFLNIDTAIPCGLIINELVSNSLKHAFPDGREGEIRIEVRSEGDGQFTLIVGDNGVSFPKDLDFRNTETLGLQLVTTLVAQLGGTIELERDGGTTFKIKFSEIKKNRS